MLQIHEYDQLFTDAFLIANFCARHTRVILEQVRTILDEKTMEHKR